MIKSVNKNLNLEDEFELRLMEELEEKSEYDCWINYCKSNYTL